MRGSAKQIFHFYPRSPCGERHLTRLSSSLQKNFYPRSPCGERPRTGSSWATWFPFLSTLSLRRATSDAFAAVSTLLISIHALLAESDLKNAITAAPQQEFLSTLSLRRATCSFCPADSQRGHFYPRSPCGERLDCHLSGTSYSKFLSTLSLRRATFRVAVPEHIIVISIHALLAESDDKPTQTAPAAVQFLSTLSLRRATPPPHINLSNKRYFYPRSPCGERQPPLIVSAKPPYFYPRSPCGERQIAICLAPPTPNFYPRSPCGERLELAFLAINPNTFLSTLSLRRATPRPCPSRGQNRNFYPRSPCGERPSAKMPRSENPR